VSPVGTGDDLPPSGADASPAGEEHGRRAATWLRDALGLALPDGLLALALTHRSWAYENGGAPTNERL
jgi:ribonuclease-3